MTMIEIRKIDETMKSQIREFVTENWGSPVMISRGETHSIDQLPGYVALQNNSIKG